MEGGPTNLVRIWHDFRPESVVWDEYFGMTIAMSLSIG